MNDPFKPSASEEEYTIAGLDDIKDSFYIEPGDYEVKCVGFVIGESNKGDPQFVWEFEIVDEGPHIGQTLKLWSNLGPKALMFLKDLVVALKLFDGGDLVMSRSKAIGARGKARIIDNLYDGRKQSKIANMYPSETAESESKTNDDIPF